MNQACGRYQTVVSNVRKQLRYVVVVMPGLLSLVSVESHSSHDEQVHRNDRLLGEIICLACVSVSVRR